MSRLDSEPAPRVIAVRDDRPYGGGRPAAGRGELALLRKPPGDEAQRPRLACPDLCECRLHGGGRSCVDAKTAAAVGVAENRAAGVFATSSSWMKEDIVTVLGTWNAHFSRAEDVSHDTKSALRVAAATLAAEVLPGAKELKRTMIFAS